MRRKVPESVGACFELIERAYLAGPWVMGERYTVCDPYLFTLTQWLPGDGVAIERFAKVQAHHAAMRERPAVQQALAEEAG
jgi:glutathione S-transferase